MGQAAETNKNADIQAIGVIVFLGVFLFSISAFFCASFVLGCLIFAILPNRARLFTRTGLIEVFLPVFVEAAKRGPREHFYWLIDPSVREREAKQKAKSGLELELMTSGALSVAREMVGIKITNNSDQLVRV